MASQSLFQQTVKILQTKGPPIGVSRRVPNWPAPLINTTINDNVLPDSWNLLPFVLFLSLNNIKRAGKANRVQQHAAHYNPFTVSLFSQDEGPIKLPASGVILTGAGAHRKGKRRRNSFLALC